ncbi:MAG: CDP-glycerol glycerophosphotransferase family protein [Desulfobacteraceae bacterium]|nr:CDP-glycerol glycerophosphotransferase family protein [Desulfobacteraceae bacterium]
MRRYLLYAAQLYSLSILRPLQYAIIARGDRAAWFFDPGIDAAPWLAPDENLLRTVGEVKAYNPDAVFVPGNVVPDFFPGLKAQVFHGLANDFVGKKGHYRIRGFFDLYCTRAAEETRIFSEMAQTYGHFEVAETGWPKLDPLFRGRVRDLRPDLGKARPIVLYASTFSPSMTSAPYLVESIRHLSEKGAWQWLVTLHPKMPAQIVEKYRRLAGPNLRFFESHDDIWPLLRAADVMLCDTSSIMLEFMLLDKPVVTYRTRSPGPHLIDVRDPGEIESAITSALNPQPTLMAAMQAFIRRFHPYRDGRSSERVLDAADQLMDKGTAHLKSKPINVIRKAKLRRKLGYYRWR